MKIILTGATGLIGSRFEELMYEKHDIIPLSSSNGVDITNLDSVNEFFLGKEADVVIHLAAKTDVDGCEQDKEDDMSRLAIDPTEILHVDAVNLPSDQWREKKTALGINTVGTKNLYEATKGIGAKFVYVSTDFIFSGEDEFYTEESAPNPVNWYGMTKYFGEKIINQSIDLIVRLSFPYGHSSPVKQDFVQKLIALIRDREEVSLIEDQTITPTFIDDIVFGIELLLQKNAVGTFHVTGSSSLSPYNIGEMIKDQYGFGTKLNTTTREALYSGKAKRPFKSIMKNEKIKNLGFTPKTFEQGLADLR